MESALRYVVLRHEGIDEPHFDLMFETSPGSALATWRSTDWPIGRKTRLEPLGDHRRAYLDFEGALTGDRGFVRRIVQGWHTVTGDDAASLAVRLDTGEELRLSRKRA